MDQPVKDYSVYLDLLVDKVKELGFDIAWTDCDACSIADSIISINERYKDKNKMHHLLHEIGHVLDYDEVGGTMKQWHARYPGLRPQSGELARRASAFEVEVRAWDCGEQLAHELGVPLDNEFHRIKTSCLKTYL